MFYLLFFLLLKPSPIQAITPTATPTIVEEVVSPTPDTSSDIQKIRDAVSQKVKEKLLQIITPDSVKKAMIGKIIELTANTLSVEYNSQLRPIQLDPAVSIIDANRNKSSLEKLKIGQDILLMGIENSSENTFLAKRIVVTDTSKLQIKKTVTFGKIVDISKSSSIMTLIPNHNKNTLFQIKLDVKTEYFTNDSQKLKATDIKSGHRVIAILRPDEKISKTYNALRLIDLDYAPTTPSPTPTKK
jgi:hypothetical protein